MGKHIQTIRRLLPTNHLSMTILRGWRLKVGIIRIVSNALRPNYAVNFLHLTIDVIFFRSKCKMQIMHPLIARVTSLSEYGHTLIFLTCDF